MGCCVKLIDAILFLYFLVIAVVTPLIHGQTCLPQTYFPDMIVNLKKWYIDEYEDYLMAEKPHFYVGLGWLEILFQWPIALYNVYAILACKPCFNNACLIYGVSVSASMVCHSFLSFFGYKLFFVFDCLSSCFFMYLSLLF